MKSAITHASRMTAIRKLDLNARNATTRPIEISFTRGAFLEPDF